MITTDLAVTCTIESALSIFAIYSCYRDYQLKEKDKTFECSAKVIRGRKSMTSIYAVYGSTMATLLIMINNTHTLDGNKVFFIAFNLICVTYLFFFSTWFRNSIFFPLIRRTLED